MSNSSYTSEVPFRLSKNFAWLVCCGFFVFDILFVVAYLLSTLPELRSLTVSHRMVFLDLNSEANLPTNYAILKLYFGALLSALMVFWYRGGAPFFWKISAAVLFIIGLDESAQLHELWAAGLAVKLFGTEYLTGNQFTIIPYAVILGAFYLSSLSLFPKLSKTAFVCFVSSGLLLILSQAVEWDFHAAMQVMFGGFEMFSAILVAFDEPTLMFAWEEGLEMMGYSMLCSGVLIGIYAVQKAELS